jgi:hypothetical protein
MFSSLTVLSVTSQIFCRNRLLEMWNRLRWLKIRSTQMKLYTSYQQDTFWQTRWSQAAVERPCVNILNINHSVTRLYCCNCTPQRYLGHKKLVPQQGIRTLTTWEALNWPRTFSKGISGCQSVVVSSSMKPRDVGPPPDPWWEAAVTTVAVDELLLFADDRVTNVPAFSSTDQSRGLEKRW